MASEGPPNPTHSQGVAQVSQDTVLPVSPAPAPRAGFGMPGAPSRRQPERSTFQNAFAAAGHWASPSPGSPLCRFRSPEGRLWGCHPSLQALPTVPPPRPQSQASRQHKGYPSPSLCQEGQNAAPAAAGLGCGSQGGEFTLSPPQTGQVEKKAGGCPAWGLPASQPSPGASQPGASVACPRRLVPSQPEGHPVDIWPPESPAPGSSGPPCAAGLWSLGAWRRLRGVS